MKRALLLALIVLAPSAAQASVPTSQRVVFGLAPNGQLGMTGAVTLGVIRGPFKPIGVSVWVKDLVTSARADARGLSYTISPKAYWYWGGRKIPVTWRDFVATVQLSDASPAAFEAAGNSPLGNIDLAHVTHHGLRQVTFYWRTTGCSDTLPCGPIPNWQSLFEPLVPSFALTSPSADTLWQECICGSDNKPISDGPFYLASYSAGENTAVLKRNPYWGGHKPALAEVDLRDATDDVDALRSGALDAETTRADATIEPLLHVPHLVVQWTTEPTLEELYFRIGDERGAPGVTKGSSNQLLRAPWMRQAIALALDRRSIVTNLFGDFARLAPPADSLLVYPFGPGYHRDFDRWDYNPTAALALLKAHCTPGTGPTAPGPANTKIWQCAGLTAVFRWTWRADSPARTTTEQLAKADLRAIGIQIVEHPLPGSVVYTTDGAASGDFDILDLSQSTTGDPSDFVDVFRCGGLRNWTGFCSDKVDALFAAGGSALDPGTRIEDYAAADLLLSQSIPAFPLYAPPRALIRKASLLGIDPVVPLSTLEDWHWKR